MISELQKTIYATNKQLQHFRKHSEVSLVAMKPIRYKLLIHFITEPLKSYYLKYSYITSHNGA